MVKWLHVVHARVFVRVRERGDRDSSLGSRVSSAIASKWLHEILALLFVECHSKYSFKKSAECLLNT